MLFCVQFNLQLTPNDSKSANLSHSISIFVFRSVWTKLHGNVLTDWLANAIINTMTWIFRGTLRDFISEQFRMQVQAIIDDINNNRGTFKSVAEVESFLHQFTANGFQKPINF